MSRLNVLAAVLFALSAVACVTKGRNFPADLSWIKKEETSQQDVQMVLGTPFMVGNSSGVQTWSYGLYHYRIVGRSYVRELKFFWNDDKTVREYSFQSSFPDDLERAGLRKKRAAPPQQNQPQQNQPQQNHLQPDQHQQPSSS